MDLSLWDRRKQIVTHVRRIRPRDDRKGAVARTADPVLDYPTAGRSTSVRKCMWEVVRTRQAAGVTSS